MTGRVARSTPTVWVLVGDLSRTGVPVVLARLLAWQRRHEPGRWAVIAARGGELSGAVGDVAGWLTVLEPDPDRSRRGWGDVASLGLTQFGAGGVGRVVRNQRYRLAVAHLPPPDVVVVHGAGGAELLDLVPPSIPVVLHLHELEVGVSRSPLGRRPELWGRFGSVLAVSEPVADLARSRGIPGSRITMVPGVVGADRDAPEREVDRGLSGGLIGGLGDPGWRKGADRMVAIAFELARRHGAGAGSPPEVVWVGGAPRGARRGVVGASEPVRWVPSRPDPWEILREAAMVLVPSREDALPLAALEAGWWGVPVVASRTGGLTRLLGEGRGGLVAGHDLLAWCDSVDRLLQDREVAVERADRLRRHVMRCHVPGVVGPVWHRAISEAAG